VNCAGHLLGWQKLSQDFLTIAPHVTGLEDWEFLSFPAIAEEDEAVEDFVATDRRDDVLCRPRAEECLFNCGFKHDRVRVPADSYIFAGAGLASFAASIGAFSFTSVTRTVDCPSVHEWIT
jgi:hypothetical protein